VWEEDFGVYNLMLSNSKQQTSIIFTVTKSPGPLPAVVIYGLVSGGSAIILVVVCFVIFRRRGSRKSKNKSMFFMKISLTS